MNRINSGNISVPAGRASIKFNNNSTENNANKFKALNIVTKNSSNNILKKINNVFEDIKKKNSSLEKRNSNKILNNNISPEKIVINEISKILLYKYIKSLIFS